MQLETERLLLREFVEDDWRAVLDYQVNPEYLRFYPWTQRTEVDVRSFVRMFCNWSKETPRRRFQIAIVLKENGRLIGNGGLRKYAAHSEIADIGYELDPRYWGRGYATEAARRLLQFGFEELNLHRIWADCIEENTASAHVLEKIGMRYEGLQRETEWMKGRWWSIKLYGMLEKDWRS
ncbi:MAG TPA: GNAT family protein [Dictyobacter sp.]|jgi:RimJ/RimL family protein N-acetyltransferase|nr:GNAT family protein [Dictyobacter sp.]